MDPEAATPADWASQREEQREKEAKLSTADRDTRAHHSVIEQALERAVSAVQEEWGARSATGWAGDVDELVRWVDRETCSEKGEIDWVGAQKEASEDGRAPLHLTSGSDGVVSLQEVIGRLVSAPRESLKALDIKVSPSSAKTDPTSPTVATLILPPSSAFLLADFKYWSSPSSGIASAGSAHGGWDLLLLELASPLRPPMLHADPVVVVPLGRTPPQRAPQPTRHSMPTTSGSWTSKAC